MRKLLAALLAVFAILMSTPSQAASPEDVRQLVQKAAETLSRDGKERAYAAFQDHNGPFWLGETYVFVINFQGAWEAYPPKPEVVGTPLLSLKDVDGKPFIQEMVELAQSKGEGWVDYKWKNPETNKIQPKSSYVKRVGDVIVAAGVYR